jgi:uncharacterized protein YidB (DUF937 family)
MSTPRQSVFDALATDSRNDDPLDQRLQADLADKLASSADANPLQRLLDDFRAAGFDADVRTWLAPGQSSAPPPLPGDAIERVAAIGHVFDTAWLDQVAARNGVDRGMAERRIAALLPRMIKTLTPRGEVPTARALQIGLEGLRRRSVR